MVASQQTEDESTGRDRCMLKWGCRYHGERVMVEAVLPAFLDIYLEWFVHFKLVRLFNVDIIMIELHH